VIVKLCLSGEGCYLSLTNILEGLKLNMNQFQSLCILAGCDYIKNVRGVGIHTAYKLIFSNDDLFHTMEKRGAPADYKESFANAMSVFLHQTVYDVNAGKTVPLREW
jgi:exonuclease-1